MRLDLDVAGYLASWEFPGSAGFEGWARPRPWLSLGGMCVARVNSTQSSELFYASTCRMLRAMHGDERQLRIVQLDCGAADPPIKAMLAGLEVDPSLNPFQAKAVLAQALMDRPTVVVMAEREPVQTKHWYEMSLLMEHFGKSTPAVFLCLIAFDSRGAISLEPSFDLSAGRCTHPLLALSQVLEEPLLWRAYLHHRACWETAGNPEQAQSLGQQLETAAVGNDERVEHVLNEFATAASERMQLGALEHHLAAAFQRIDGAAREAARGALQVAGALWRPPGSQRLELTPLTSRELLKRTNVPEELIPRLRHNLICMPLAVEILAHCLNAEAKIRMQLTGKQVRPADARVLEAHRRFTDGSSSDDFVHYPESYPLPPNRPGDLWLFAGLGQTMFACDRDDVPERLWETVNLRNAVAHGHYLTWRHVRRAVQQQRRFDV